MKKHIHHSAWEKEGAKRIFQRTRKALHKIFVMTVYYGPAFFRRELKKWKAFRLYNLLGYRLRKKFEPKRIRLTVLLVLFSLCLVFTIHAAYHLYQSEELGLQSQLMNEVKSELDQANKAFDQYLELMSYRIQEQSLSDQKILDILKTDTNQFASEPFPYVLSLTYVPSLEGKKTISRLGPVEAPLNTPSSFINEHNDGRTFLIEKKVGTQGLIRAYISLERILPQIVVKANPDTAQEKKLTFTSKVGSQEVTYHLNRSLPSVYGFINRQLGIIFLLCFTAVFFCFIGSALNIYTARRQNKNLIGENSHFRNLNNRLEKRYADREAELIEELRQLQQSLSKAEKREGMLLSALESYRQQARHWFSSCGHMMTLLPAMHLQEVISSQLLIFLSQMEAIFKKISSGLPFPQEEEYVRIVDIVKECMLLFEGRNIQFEDITLGIPSEEAIAVDARTLRVILYNLIRLTLDKFYASESIRVEIRYENGVKISLIDNGCTRQPIGRKGELNIFELTKSEVAELAQDAGWSLKFISGETKNSCTLFLPGHDLSRGNVVYLSKRKNNT